MAQIIVRNLDDSLKAQLAMQARNKGHSMEEEVRRILQREIEEKRSGFGTRIASRFKDIGLEDEIPELKGEAVHNPFADI